MRERQRHDDPIPVPDPPHAGGPNPRETQADRGAALLAAADEAINRALSGDSLSFIARSRQMGGE